MGIHAGVCTYVNAHSWGNACTYSQTYPFTQTHQNLFGTFLEKPQLFRCSHMLSSINQTVFNVLFSILARVGRFDPQQLSTCPYQTAPSLHTVLPYIALLTLLPWLLTSAHTPEPLNSNTLTPSPPHLFSPHVHTNGTYPSELHPRHSLSPDDQATHRLTSSLSAKLNTRASHSNHNYHSWWIVPSQKRNCVQLSWLSYSRIIQSHRYHYRPLHQCSTFVIHWFHVLHYYLNISLCHNNAFFSSSLELKFHSFLKPLNFPTLISKIQQSLDPIILFDKFPVLY